MARGNSTQRPTTTKAKARAKEAARAEAERLRLEREAKARRQRTITIASIVGGIVVVVGLSIAVVLAVQSTQEVSSKPVGAQSSGGILIGRDGAAGGEAPAASEAVTVEIYSDYMCPNCGNLEEGIAKALEELRESGEIRLVLHPVAFLDRLSSDSQYSTRSTDHAATVAREEPDKFLEFHEALFANQPDENTEGLTDEEMATIAQEVGVSEATTALFATLEMADWVDSSTNRAINDGWTSTPTVILQAPGGEKTRWLSYGTGDIKGAVEKIKAGEPID
jgi:protein-disulfide isomerase